MPRTVAELEHLSYSSISSYLLCPRAWRFHYLDQIETPTSPALIFGSAFHETIEEYIYHQTEIPDPLHVETPNAVECWARHWSEQLERNTEHGIAWNSNTPEKMNNLGVKMFSDPDTVALVDSLQPLVIEDQIQIERKVTLTVPGVPIPIIGYIDLIEQDGVPADFKTSARSWSQKQANAEMQPCFYLAAMNQMGLEHNGLNFRHYIFVKTKTPKVQIWESQRTVFDLFWLFGLITDVWKGIQAEVFPPNPGTWKCSPKYCEHWGICRGAE